MLFTRRLPCAPCTPAPLPQLSNWRRPHRCVCIWRARTHVARVAERASRQGAPLHGQATLALTAVHAGVVGRAGQQAAQWHV
eukprot:354411-Chlamydomonas_euryale.AAC.5